MKKKIMLLVFLCFGFIPKERLNAQIIIISGFVKIPKRNHYSALVSNEITITNTNVYIKGTVNIGFLRTRLNSDSKTGDLYIMDSLKKEYRIIFETVSGVQLLGIFDLDDNIEYIFSIDSLIELK